LLPLSFWLGPDRRSRFEERISNAAAADAWSILNYIDVTFHVYRNGQTTASRQAPFSTVNNSCLEFEDESNINMQQPAAAQFGKYELESFLTTLAVNGLMSDPSAWIRG
jgi:hypothetical protein